MVDITKSVEDKYKKEGSFQNPTRKGAVDVPYILDKVRYIYSNYVRNTDGIHYSLRSDFSELRSYANGKQDENKYIPMLIGGSTGTGKGGTFNSAGVDIGATGDAKFNSEEWKRKALGHINWKIMSPAPKIINKILATFTNTYEINIECVDENSINAQDTEKWKAWVESQADYIQTMSELSQVAGVPYEPPTKRIGTIEELELFEANGGFKLNYAKEGEKIIKDAWNISNEDEIDEKIIKDLATINYGAYRVYYDREVGKEMFRYVDPAFAGCQHSKHNDFRDSMYAYEQIWVPVYKLQAYGIDTKDIPVIARHYSGMYGNPEWDDSFDFDPVTNDMRCGFFKVPVLDVEFVDMESDKKVKYKTKYGAEQIKDYSGEQLSASKQLLETKNPMVYQAKWIVDTDIVYDWGLKPNQPKKEKNQSMLSFHFIKGKTEKSLIEQLVPILDSFQMNWLKFQDAKASAVKAGYAIEWEAMQGMKLGGEKADPMDMLSVHRITGNMFFTRRNRHSQMTTSKPIEFLPNGMGSQIQEFVTKLDIDARMMEEITGINPVSLGATANPNAGKAVTEMAVASSASPIKNMFDKTFQLKAHASLDLLMRVQLNLRNSPTMRKRYSSVIGDYGVQTLVEAEGKGVRFGTVLVARPTSEDKAMIQQYINVALTAGKNGVPAISVAEALYLQRRLAENANLKELELFIGYKIKQSEEQQQAYAQQAAQQQIGGQQQYEQLKAQNAQALAQLQVQTANQIAAFANQLSIQLEEVKSQNKIKEIQAQSLHKEAGETTNK
ncbi:MAG: portal protein [Candidatus Doudnabacteria bacterium]